MNLGEPRLSFLFSGFFDTLSDGPDMAGWIHDPDRSGNLRELKLIKGPDIEFTRAARKAMAQQKFEPASYRGKPVDVIYHVSINHVPVKKVKGPC